MYAGNGEFWDAGWEGTGAFVGVTKTTYETGGDAYTCSYRYKK